MEMLHDGYPQEKLFSDPQDITSSEDSEDLYREKFENLKEICQTLQREIRSQKIRNEGVDTLTTCLQEEREENQKLRIKIKKIESGLSVHQKKSFESGEFGHSYNESGPTSQGEVFAPGTSKQLLDNLVRENLRLQQSLKSVDRDPRKMEQLQMRVEELETEKQELVQILGVTKQENQRLNTLMASSPKNKDSEIARLQKKIELLEKNREDQDERCQSLSEESQALRGQLKELADMCQQMAKKLDDRDSKVSSSTPRLAMGHSSMTVDQASEEFAALRIQNTDLRQELDKQGARQEELIQTNNRWEVYNKDREVYLQKLQSKLKEQEERIHRMSVRPGFSEDQQQEIDRIIQGYKKKVELTEEDKGKIEDENRLLRMENQRQQQAIAALQRQMQTMAQQGPYSNQFGISSPGRAEDRERIQVLEAQIQICTDDFRQEREDREKAQAKVAELEEEMDLVKRQLDQFQVSHMTRLHNQRMSALSNYRNEYANQQYHHGGSGQLLARGIVADGDDDAVEDGDEDIVDSLPTPSGSSTHPKPNMSSRVVPDDTLQCPKCRTDFPANSHREFLEHIDECCT